jgi:polyhydroxyalkanoate synthesis regulator phasin
MEAPSEMTGSFRYEETKMSEVEELREQVEALQQQFANLR